MPYNFNKLRKNQRNYQSCRFVKTIFIRSLFVVLISTVLLIVFFLKIHMAWEDIYQGISFWWLHFIDFAGLLFSGTYFPDKVPDEGTPLFLFSRLDKSIDFSSPGYTLVHEMPLAVTKAISTLTGFVCAFLGFRLRITKLMKASRDKSLHYVRTKECRNSGSDRPERDNVSVKLDSLRLTLGQQSPGLLLHGISEMGQIMVLTKLLRQLRARGDIVIIYDKDCSLVPHLYKPRCDKLLNPFDRRCEYWDLWAEYHHFQGAMKPGAIFPTKKEDEPFLSNAVQKIFTDIAARYANASPARYCSLLRSLRRIKPDMLKRYLSSKANQNFNDAELLSVAVRVCDRLSRYADAFFPLLSMEPCTDRPPFTIREWLSECSNPGQRAGWLWLTNHEMQPNDIYPLLSMWFKRSIECLLDADGDPPRHVWFICNDVASLNFLAELPTMLQKFSKNKAHFIASLQDIQQFEDVYGEKQFNMLMGTFGTRIFFRSPDELTARKISKELNRFQTKRGGLEVFDNVYRNDVLTCTLPRIQRLRNIHFSAIQGLDANACYVTTQKHYPLCRLQLKDEVITASEIDYFPVRPLC